jgi:hypothetical protein
VVASPSPSCWRPRRIGGEESAAALGSQLGRLARAHHWQWCSGAPPAIGRGATNADQSGEARGDVRLLWWPTEPANGRRNGDAAVDTASDGALCRRGEAAGRAARALEARGRGFIGAGGSAWRGAHAEGRRRRRRAHHGLWWPSPDGPSRVVPEGAGRSRLGRVHGLGQIE